MQIFSFSFPKGHRSTVSERDDYLFFFLYKLYNAINTNRLAGLWINEHICRVHIFKVQSVANVVCSITITIVMKAFFTNHLVNFCGIVIRSCNTEFCNSAYVFNTQITSLLIR